MKCVEGWDLMWEGANETQQRLMQSVLQHKIQLVVEFRG